MKPYLFNYSETIQIVPSQIEQCLKGGTIKTFSIENSDADDVLIDETMMTKSLENVDYDIYDASSTIVTNVVEHSDQDSYVAGTYMTRTLENSDHEGVTIFADSTIITKKLESTDAD